MVITKIALLVEQVDRAAERVGAVPAEIHSRNLQKSAKGDDAAPLRASSLVLQHPAINSISWDRRFRIQNGHSDRITSAAIGR
jgi:hypothetical protein